MEETLDKECGNCGDIVEVEVWVEGECGRCGTRYWWDEYFGDDEDGCQDGDPVIVWGS